jgi:hypothetical protein
MPPADPGLLDPPVLRPSSALVVSDLLTIPKRLVLLCTNKPLRPVYLGGDPHHPTAYMNRIAPPSFVSPGCCSLGLSSPRGFPL